MGKSDLTNDIVVPKSEFDRDPRAYMRQATSERQVIVKHDRSGRISAVFGGCLDVVPDSPISRRTSRG